MQNTYKQLLKEIKQQRRLKNITQAEMAKNLGISQSAYAQIENGKIMVSIERFVRLGRILDYPIEEIFKPSNFADPTTEHFLEIAAQVNKELEKRDLYFRNIESMIHILGEKIQECLNVYAPGNKELYMKLEQIGQRHQDLLNAVDLYKLGLSPVQDNKST